MVNSQLIRSKHILGLPIFDACFYEAVFLHNVALLFWHTVESISNSLFDSFAVVNAYIGWKNHVLKDKPDREKLKKSIQYGVRNFRLKLIQRWAKKAMRHYAKTQPHKNKRRKLVNPTYVCLKSVVRLP